MTTTRNHVAISDLKVLAFVVLIAFFVFAVSCQSSEKSESNIKVDWNIQPSPPTVGKATITIILKDSTNHLIEGAMVKLEGNMSHPGMKPVIATANETEPGNYTADVQLHMSGDWFFLIESTLPDDTVVERQININGVRTQ